MEQVKGELQEERARAEELENTVSRLSTKVNRIDNEK